MNWNRIVGWVIFFSIAGLPVYAQDIDKVKNLFLKLGHKYDTSTNLSFGIRITYIDEPEGKTSSTETSDGYYFLKGTKAVYRIDEMEAMQNDSFFIAVDAKSRYIMVSKPKDVASMQFFPFRQTLDSLLRLSANKYTIKQLTTRSKRTGKVSFDAKDSTELVKQFIFEYDTEFNHILSLKYFSHEYKQAAEDFKEEDPRLILHKKTMFIAFSQYSHKLIDEALFKEARYITFQNGSYEPAGKYAGYKLYYSSEPLIK